MKPNLTIDEKHVYRVDGVIVPSVTQILDVMSNYRKVNKVLLDAAAAFGDAVHDTLHLYDTFNLEEYDPILTPYIEHWEQFRKDHNVTFLHVEHMLYSGEFKYAGTPDRVANIDGRLAIVDIKTGQPAKYVGLQLAGYALLAEWEFKTAYRDIDRYSVFIDEKGYKLKKYTGRDDKNEFLTLLYARNVIKKYKGGD